MAVSKVVVHDESLKRMLSKLQSNWPDLQRQLLTRYSEEILKRTQNNVTGGNPLNVRSGRLRNSLGWEMLSDDTAAVGTNVRYGPVHEFGATITPKNAPYLRFKTDSGWVSTKSVKIPKRPWLGPALLDFVRSGQDRVTASILNKFLRKQS